MYQRILAAALLVLVVQKAPAQTPPDGPPAPQPSVFVPHGFMTGNAYRNWAQFQRQQYVTGLFDGILVASLFGADAKMLSTFKSCMAGMTNEQLTAILDKYLKDHPESWQLDMQIIAVDAINAICPQFTDVNKAYWRRQAPGR